MNVSARLPADIPAPERDAAPDVVSDPSAFGSFLVSLLHPQAPPLAPTPGGGEAVAVPVEGGASSGAPVPPPPAIVPEGNFALRERVVASVITAPMSVRPPDEGASAQPDEAVMQEPEAPAAEPVGSVKQAAPVAAPIATSSATRSALAAMPAPVPADVPVGSGAESPSEPPDVPTPAPFASVHTSRPDRALSSKPVNVGGAEARVSLQAASRPAPADERSTEASPSRPEVPAVEADGAPEPGAPAAEIVLPAPAAEPGARRAEAPEAVATGQRERTGTETVLPTPTPPSEKGSAEAPAGAPELSTEGVTPVPADAGARPECGDHGADHPDTPVPLPPADVPVTPPVQVEDGTNVPVSGKDVRVEKAVAEAAEGEELVAEEAAIRLPESAPGPDAALPEGPPPADREHAAHASQTPTRGEPHAVPQRAETARTAHTAVLMDRWQADLQGLVTELRTEAGGWQRLRLRLDDEGGTVTLRARREADHVAVTVAFSDPMLRQAAQASAERLHTALETQLGQQVAFSFDGGGGDARQHASTGDRAAPPFAPSSTASESDRPAPLPRRRAAGNREWIG